VLPHIPSQQCLVRARDHSDSATCDTSDNVFTISNCIVPDIVGMAQPDAEAAIIEAGLAVGTIQYCYSESMTAAASASTGSATGNPAMCGSPTHPGLVTPARARPSATL